LAEIAWNWKKRQAGRTGRTCARSTAIIMMKAVNTLSPAWPVRSPGVFTTNPAAGSGWLKDLRNREIKRLFSGGWKISELAPLFSLSPRTIQRALSEEKG